MVVLFQTEDGTPLSREEWYDDNNGMGWDLEYVLDYSEEGETDMIRRLFKYAKTEPLKAFIEMHDILELVWEKGEVQLDSEGKII